MLREADHEKSNVLWPGLWASTPIIATQRRPSICGTKSRLLVITRDRCE